MKTAKQMLKAKQAVKEEMDRRFPQSLSDDLWNKAEIRLDGILKKYTSLSGGVRTHTDHYIFPAAAIYLTLCEVTSRENAYAVIENTAIEHSNGQIAVLLHYQQSFLDQPIDGNADRGLGAFHIMRHIHRTDAAIFLFQQQDRVQVTLHRSADNHDYSLSFGGRSLDKRRQSDGVIPVIFFEHVGKMRG